MARVYREGDIGNEIMQRKVALQGGAMLAIDYGYGTTQTGETLQAVKDHEFADPLEAPGDADLSSHVNFDVLATAGASCCQGCKPDVRGAC